MEPQNSHQTYALISGASLGIGKALAYEHASAGGNLILVARSLDKLKALKSELEKNFNIEVEVIAKDLSREGSGSELYDEIRSKGLRVEYLINNAGIGSFGEFATKPWSEQQEMIHLNIRSLTEMCHLFLPEMKEMGSGRIMNVASTAAFQPGPLMTVYYASKHYVLAFSEGLAEEVKKHGISVTTLCPGPTQSGFKSAAGMENSGLFKKQSVASAEEVAAYGYRKMLNGKRIVIPGLKNRLLSWLAFITPPGISGKVAKNLQKEV